MHYLNTVISNSGTSSNDDEFLGFDDKDFLALKKIKIFVTES